MKKRMDLFIVIFAVFVSFLMVSTAIGSPATQIKNKMVINKYAEYLEVLESFSKKIQQDEACLLYTSPSPRDRTRSRMPSSA